MIRKIIVSISCFCIFAFPVFSGEEPIPPHLQEKYLKEMSVPEHMKNKGEDQDKSDQQEKPESVPKPTPKVPKAPSKPLGDIPDLFAPSNQNDLPKKDQPKPSPPKQEKKKDVPKTESLPADPQVERERKVGLSVCLFEATERQKEIRERDEDITNLLTQTPEKIEGLRKNLNSVEIDWDGAPADLGITKDTYAEYATIAYQATLQEVKKKWREFKILTNPMDQEYVIEAIKSLEDCQKIKADLELLQEKDTHVRTQLGEHLDKQINVANSEHNFLVEQLAQQEVDFTEEKFEEDKDLALKSKIKSEANNTIKGIQIKMANAFGRLSALKKCKEEVGRLTVL